MIQGWTRRRLLGYSGVGLAVGVAGCGAESGDDETGDAQSAGQQVDGDEHHHGDGEHDHTGEHGDRPSEPADWVTVSMATDGDEHHFDPHVSRVDTGGTVEWVLESGLHTATAYHPDSDRPRRIPADAAAFDSGTLQDGETFEHVFDVEGVYDYYCVPHEGVGMIGSVIVGRPDPEGDEPGLSDPTQGGDEGSTLQSLTTRALELLRGEGTDGGTAIDAATLDEADGEIDIQVRTDDGSVRPGRSHPIVARFEGQRLANAPVDVEGDFQRYTADDGTVEVSVPRDLDSDDECRIETRVDSARGRVKVPVTG